MPVGLCSKFNNWSNYDNCGGCQIEAKTSVLASSFIRGCFSEKKKKLVACILERGE